MKKKEIEKVEHEVESIGKDVADLVNKLLHPVPKEYQVLHDQIGGPIAMARDGIATLQSVLAPSLRGAQEHTEVFSTIQEEHYRLMRSAGFEDYSNPMDQFVSVYNLLSEDSQTLIVAILDGLVPDWRKLPVVLQNCQEIIAKKTTRPQGKDSLPSERSSGIIVFLVFLRTLSSGISAAGQFFPLSIGIGAMVGASVVVEGQVKIDTKILNIGACVLLLKVVCDAAYEIVNQVTAP